MKAILLCRRPLQNNWRTIRNARIPEELERTWLRDMPFDPLVPRRLRLAVSLVNCAPQHVPIESPLNGLGQ
jgi:hypothetical protein